MDVVIVGAGLAGLVAAERLQADGVPVKVVEARSRVGGRIMTVRPDELDADAWFDLGATWVWADQHRVRTLATELGVQLFPQYREGRAVEETTEGIRPVVVAMPEPAEYRLRGGAHELCRRLADRLAPGTLGLGQPVVAIAGSDREGLTLTTVTSEMDFAELHATHVVIALPPRLVPGRIDISPALPDSFLDVLRATPTWMSTALKVVAVYDRPFWRDAGWSGYASSDVGPLSEIHDGGTDRPDSPAGLWGFVTGAHHHRDIAVEERAPLVFEQLARLFGSQATEPINYFERDWSSDPNTNDETIWMDRPLLDYGHDELLQPAVDGRLFWAGTETSADGGGHMEGAVASGQRVAEQVRRAGVAN